MRTFRRVGAVFAGLLAAYIVLMALAYAIPNEAIQKNVDASLEILNEEGEYPQPFFHFTHPYNFKYKSSQLDNHTDILMMKHSIKTEGVNPFVASVDKYSRYWHGYEVFLRPQLLIMDYSTIRQLNMFLFFLLFCALYALIKERLGFGAANFFVIAMMSGFAILVPVSMQFFSVFAVSFIASIAVLYLEKQDRRQFGFLFYFVTGSVTSFLDLLTAPLFTLCLPLVLSVLLEIREKRAGSLKGQFIKVITCSVGWGFGFGLTWMFKWLYSSVLLGRNVFMEAFNAMVLRTGGGFEVREDFSNSLVVTWGANIMRLCTPVVLAALIAAFVIWLAAFCLYRKPWGQLKELLAVLFVAAYPYFWYAVLSYHSQGHGWFTYRVQLASIFAVLCAMLYSIDLQRVKHKLFKVGKAGD